MASRQPCDWQWASFDNKVFGNLHHKLWHLKLTYHLASGVCRLLFCTFCSRSNIRNLRMKKMWTNWPTTQNESLGAFDYSYSLSIYIASNLNNLWDDLAPQSCEAVAVEYGGTDLVCMADTLKLINSIHILVHIWMKLHTPACLCSHSKSIAQRGRPTWPT